MPVKLESVSIALPLKISITTLTFVLQMIFIVPLFFQITKNACTAAAGTYLLPAIIGNTIGGLLSGVYIKR